MSHHGKPFKVVWHRATLDSLTASSLIDGVRLVGDVVSGLSGQALSLVSVHMLRKQDMPIRRAADPAA